MKPTPRADIRHHDHIVLLVDTFYGKNGWDNHARFKIVTTKNDKFLSQINGQKLPHHIFKQVTSQVI